jgi:hypothetical protein
MRRTFVGSIEAEFRRYKALAEGALRQLREPELGQARSPGDNSVATIVWHISGNLKSRFTDFLVSDGEKPWRDRESEFQPRDVTRAELDEKWAEGWQALLATLGGLRDEDLDQLVSIRGVPLRVEEALHRSLAHTSYHAGQIVLLSKMLRGPDWQYLSIPPGESDAYDRNPTLEKVADHVDRSSR